MAKEEVNTEPKFSVDVLRKHCKELFGVMPEVFDGAFYNASGEFAKDEAKKKIDDFLKKGVE